MMTFDDLPVPTDAALARSHRLTELIRTRIHQAGGAIPFSAFMAAALYEPELGYYMADAVKIGRAGDFITAPEVSPLFARSLANQFVSLFELGLEPQILELGAGTGRFTADLIQALATANRLPAHYFIYEISPHLRKHQQDFLQQTHPAYFSRFIWLDELPKEFEGIIFGNEVLDALPVDLFQIEQTPLACQVAWDNDGFSWQLTPAAPPLANRVIALQKEFDLPAGYRSELATRLQPFIAALATCLSKGIILLADYGYGRAEYYDPARTTGTLTCFYQHRKHANPLMMVGLQDITAHVDFTTVAEEGFDQELSLAGYTTQAAFLLGCGLSALAQQAEEGLSPAAVINLRHGLKTLTLPSEMGERIKIMGLSKGIDLPALMGFSLADRRRNL